MRRLFRRSILWLVPVVLAPVGVLLVVQYNTLRTLERTTAQAERNWLRGALESANRGVEDYYRTAAMKALTLDAAALRTPELAAKHFAASSIDGAKTFFVIPFGDDAAPAYFDPAGRTKALTAAEGETIKVATASWSLVHKLGSVVASPSLQVDERDPRNRVIVRPLTDAAMHVTGVAGVVFDEDLARAAVTRIATKTAQLAAKDDDLSFAVRDRHQSPLDDSHTHTLQSLGFVFTDWRLAMHDACPAPEEVAACNFRLNAIWSGIAIVVVIAAIVLGFQAAARQMRLSRMKSDFVSNVSHELRTPLSSIRVFGEYMRLGRVTRDEKIREYGEYIEAESRRLTHLINNILDFSKIESEERKYVRTAIDIVPVVTQTVAAIERPLREQGFTIRVDAPREALIVDVDREAIAQTIVNLLDNAVKYSGDRREIEVSVEASGGDVRIAVQDHGIGIAQCEQKKVFDKFYRVCNGLVHDVKGSGLGLAIVAHIVKAHRGRVEIASAPGEGSRFTIVLPRNISHEAAPVGRTEFA